MIFQIERLRRLPQHTSETWQGGLTKLPMWIQERSREPYRPWIAGWISLRTRLIHTTEPKPPQEKSFEMALDALAEFACNGDLAGYRPGKVEVKDTALAEHLAGLLAEAGIAVEHRDKLFTFDQMISDMAEKVKGRPLVPNALDVKGVTVDLMRAFADAASQYYQAKPWQHLTGEDLIEVESPFIETGLRYLTVLGSGGTTFGLGFFESVSQFESFFQHRDVAADKHWSVLFGPITELPLGDADLWEDYNLPVAGKDAYPAAICSEPRPKQKRPGPDVLAFLEGLLRALAQTTEDEMDSGRWKKSVSTSNGKMAFTLALPDLLKPDDEELRRKVKIQRGMLDPRSLERTHVDIQRMIHERGFKDMNELRAFLDKNVIGKPVPHQPAKTALEQAQDIVYDAFDAWGRKQLQLVRQALQICPDCADAYVILAERCPDVEKSRDLYAEGVAAGERALGKEFFEQEAGRFWGMLQTRPYMRARLGLAQCLERLGNLEEAAEHYRELLRLNANDNQGVRDLLLPCLLKMNADDEAEALLKKYKGDKLMAVWSYARALLTFRQKGDTATARNHLRNALSVNRHVPKYLLDEELPELLPSGYSLGSKEEAIICAEQLIDAWEATAGAIDWLKSQT
jgi:tetratricopeptide (TPR) repeat protein